MPRYVQSAPRRKARRQARSIPSHLGKDIPDNSTPWTESPVTSVAEAIAIADQVTALANEWQPKNQ